MKTLKKIIYLTIVISVVACATHKTGMHSNQHEEKPVVIKNDSLEYEIVVLDPGFNFYLQSIARPMHFYSKQFYKNKNIRYVFEWNNRVRNNNINGSTNTFQMEIDYQSNIDYGLEVEYKLYNYFRFVEYRYKVNFNVTSLPF